VVAATAHEIPEASQGEFQITGHRGVFVMPIVGVRIGKTSCSVYGRVSAPKGGSASDMRPYVNYAAAPDAVQSLQNLKTGNLMRNPATE
jgi:hypothetical protein